MSSLRFLLVLLSIAGPWTAGALPAYEPIFQNLELAGGKTLQYAISVPPGYDSERAYPVLLAFPPGRQDRDMVMAGFGRYWGKQASSRGWVVISPVAPEGELFFTGAEQYLPDLIRQLRIDFRVEGNRIHLAGASNGGRSAFRAAIDHPHEFASLVVLPGYPPESGDAEKLSRLKGLAVRMFVGGQDTRWIDRSRRTAEQLRKLEVDVTFTELPGEGHVPPSMDGDRVMDLLVSLHGARPVPKGPASQVSIVLDDFHDAAAKADGARYFGHFAPDGVFLGTDATERWTVPEFRQWSERFFQRESAWIYVPGVRHIDLDPGGTVAWFDEVVVNAHYGECRGSGVLRRIDGQWKISQYNLTIPIPNALARTVVDLIRAGAPPTPAADGTGITTVYLVRHAEKVVSDPSDRDPDLTEVGRARSRALAQVLRGVRLDGVYTSEFRRTKETARITAEVQGLSPTVMPARQIQPLARKIQESHAGGTVLVCGHSNTVPAIIRALGVKEKVSISESEYDNLFVVRVSPAGATLTELHFESQEKK